MKFFFVTTALFFSINLSVFAAEYPDTSIAIIDLNKILSDAKAAVQAGKDIEKISSNIQNELQISDDGMLAEQQKLIEQQAIIAPDAFEIKARKFDEKASAYQSQRQEKLLEIDITH